MFSFAVRVSALIFFAIGACAPSSSARALYVSPQGNDDHDGANDRPWRTLRASFAKLVAGDTLNVGGGRYCEDRLALEVNGNVDSPVVIRSAPGEQAWIGGGGCLFIDEGSGAWEIVDQKREIYRASSPLTSEVTGGWMTDEGIQLLPYTDRNLFTSSWHGLRGYIGPGYWIEGNELQIRLQGEAVEQDDSGAPADQRISALESDPNRHSFLLSAGKAPGLTIRKSSYVLLQDLDLAPGDRRTVEVTGGSHHITLEHCNILVRTLGVVAQKGTHDLAVKGCTFRMGFPNWVAWSDVKGGKRGAAFNPADDAGWNSFAMVGVWKKSVIERNQFFDCFDAIFLRAGSENVLIDSNSIVRSRDDAIDLAPGVDRIEIARNLIWRCFEGISLVGEKGGGNAGEVFIHHNVIDVSAKHRAERKGDFAHFHAEWSAGIPFGRHDCGPECNGARWRLYNNTIVARGKTKLVPNAMPKGILANNLFIDAEESLPFAKGKAVDRAEFTTAEEVRERYRPAASKAAVDAEPPGASYWPGFDPRRMGAVSSRN